MRLRELALTRNACHASERHAPNHLAVPNPGQADPMKAGQVATWVGAKIDFKKHIGRVGARTGDHEAMTPGEDHGPSD